MVGHPAQPGGFEKEWIYTSSGTRFFLSEKFLGSISKIINFIKIKDLN
jgi:hypothetical protein